MPSSRSRLFSRLARGVNTQGTITTAGISSDVELGGGVTVYDSAAALPISNLTAGDQAWAGNRLYISNGSGWYNIALVNAAPRFVSITDSDGIETPYALSIEGTPITITLVGADSDGSGVTYSYTKDSDFDGLATITGTGSEYTVTPLSQDSATTTSGTVTFKVSDGISFDTSVNTFTLNFVSPLWKNVVASVGHSDGQGATTAAVADRSGNGYSIGINSASGYPAQGSFHPYLDNWSAQFDGVNDYLRADAALDSLLYGTDIWTIEGWFWSDGNATDGSIIPIGINLNSTGDNIFLYRLGSIWIGSTAYNLSSAISQRQWVHVAITFDASNVKVYHDGVEVLSQSIASMPYAFAVCVLGIGAEFDAANGGTPGNYYKGYISDFRVSNNVRYTSSFTPSTQKHTSDSNTLFLGLRSNRWIDNSSANVIVTAYNGTTTSAFNPFGQGSEYAPFNRYGSLWFGDDDNDASIQVTDGTVTDFGTDDFTIEFWFYPSGSIPTTTYTIVNGFNNPGVPGTAEFYIQTSGQNRRLTWNAYTSSWTTVAYSNTDWDAHTWTHAAFVRNGTSCKIYQNGVEVASATVASNQSFNNDFSNTRIGCNQGNTSEFRGYLADFRITKGTAVYTSAFTPPTDKVGAGSSTVYLPMDNAYIYDKAGNGNILNNSSTVDSTYSKFGSFAYKGARIPIPIGLEADKWTLEFWWRSDYSAFSLLNVYNSSGSNVMAMDLDVSYGTHYGYRFGWAAGLSGNIGGVSFGGQFADGWEHMALVRSGSSIRFYQDGVYRSTVSIGSNNITSSGGYIQFATSRWIENAQFLVGTEKYTGTSGSFTLPTEEQGYGTQTTGAAS